jgi:hypothetical protein
MLLIPEDFARIRQKRRRIRRTGSFPNWLERALPGGNSRKIAQSLFLECEKFPFVNFLSNGIKVSRDGLRDYQAALRLLLKHAKAVSTDPLRL